MIDPFANTGPAALSRQDESEGRLEVGARLKVVREQNGLSQRELAKRSSVTHSSISMIEQGQNSPSVSSLEKILSGIPMTLAQFFICDPDNASQVVYRSSELIGQQKQYDQLIVQDIPQKSVYSGISLQKFILLCLADIGAIPQLSNQAVSGLVVSGQLELTANTHVSLLHAGDAFSLSAQQPYRLRNLSSATHCELLVCKA
ncbi:MAG TPA: helix-turn-helix domain-containing protein [Cellvibrio sp.]|nr:helix-turn-helix domain-containing protein [Cellvibrio sp.]